jgi:hypothetical protein
MKTPGKCLLISGSENLASGRLAKYFFMRLAQEAAAREKGMAGEV